MWLGDELFEFHPIIGKCLSPGIQRVLKHSEWGDYSVQSNNLGFRCNHEFLPSKKNGVARILLFGDSNAFGDGVSYEVSFAGVLERDIPNIEILNFAMSGFALDQQYLCYQEIGSKFDHDLIVIAPTVETIRKLTAHYILALDKNHVSRCLAKPYFDLQDGKLVRGHLPLRDEYIDVDSISEAEKEKIYRANPFADARKLLDITRPLVNRRKKFNIMDRVNYLLRKMHLKNPVTQVRPYPEYDSSKNPAWRIMRAILMEWAVASPKPLLLIPLPSFIYVKERADARNYQMRFREAGKDAACSLYDPLQDIHKLSMEERRKLYYLEGHLTPQGHAFMGKMIAPHVVNILQKSAFVHPQL